jgi:hypothetical protein
MPAGTGYLPRAEPGTPQQRGNQDASPEIRSIITKSTNGTGATS